MANLRVHELKFLSVLEQLGGKSSVQQLISTTEFSDAAVMRIALTLQEKKLVTIHAEPQVIVKLGAEGEAHAENGLPERRLIKALVASGGKAELEKTGMKIHTLLQIRGVANTLYEIGAIDEENLKTILKQIKNNRG